MRKSRLLPTVILVILTGLWAGVQPPAGQAGEDVPEKAMAPEEIVNDTVAKVRKVLQDPQYNDPAKKKAMREKVRSIILAVVDMKSVATLTLANYRERFSNEQFDTFRDLLSRLLFSTYISHVEKHSADQVNVLGTEKLSESRMRVRTRTVTADKEIPIDFSFAKLGKGWRLYDIHVEGVSLLNNYRSQFREILLRKSPDELLEQLREKVKENEGGL